VLNPFGGGKPTKGFLEQHSELLAREIDGLVEEGYVVRSALGPRYREHLQAHAAIARQNWAAVSRLGSAAHLGLFRAAESDNDVIRREARWTLARTLGRVPDLVLRPGGR
jgi:hypothetical protein